MRERRQIALLIFCAAVAAALVFSTRPISAQNHQHGNRHGEHGEGDREEPPFPIYNPYPPGILPANLNSEIARVLAEVDFIESRAITRWHNLTPPTLTGQPPTL